MYTNSLVLNCSISVMAHVACRIGNWQLLSINQSIASRKPLQGIDLNRTMYFKSGNAGPSDTICVPREAKKVPIGS